MIRPETSNRQTPIAVVGMSCLFPQAEGIKQYWRLLRGGEDAVTDVPKSHWSANDYFSSDRSTPDMTYCRRGAFLSPTVFDPTEFGIPPAALEATDTAQLFGLRVAKEALADAGYGNGREFDRSRTSVILGVTGTLELVIPLGARLGGPIWRRALSEAGVNPDVAEDVVRRISESYVGWQENSFPGLLGNVVAGRIANRLDLKGTNCVVDAACASSLSAIHMATMELAAGRSDMVITGGADTLNDIFMFMCFSKTQALSLSGDARPFSKDADGTVIGEGIGIVVLKRLADAERDGDRIYAVLRGLGTSSDGKSQSIYAPLAAGQAEALRDAYKGAGIDPSTVELVEAHGTGTKVGDIVEFESLKSVFREAQPEGKWCALGSVKSQIGHAKAASGAASMIKSVLALHHKVLPPTIKVSEPNPKLGIEDSPFYLSTQARPWFANKDHSRRSSFSSFGFGGSNFHAVLEEYRADKAEAAWDGSVEIIALSAPDRDQLGTMVGQWVDACAEGMSKDEWSQRAAASREAFSSKDKCRLVLVAAHDEDWEHLLSNARQTLATKRSEASWSLPGVYFSEEATVGKIAFVFPGQGSQYVQMGRDLTCVFPEALNAVAEADSSGSLVGKIYPPPVFGDKERASQQAALTSTDVAQPAIGAVSVAAFEVLRRFGVEPDMAVGHSYGELVALYAGGRIDAQTLRDLSSLRGRLMAEGTGERGTMLAVKGPLAEIDKLLASEGLDVVLANRNSPTQGVLSGSKDSIAKAEKACRDKGWATTALQVSAAFHSKLMADAHKQFSEALESVSFKRGSLPVYANATADVYSGGAKTAGKTLGDQLVSPVRFVEQIEAMYEAGAVTFVEVGPKATVTGLVRSILGDKPHNAMAIDASSGKKSGLVDLGRVLAQLASIGHAVDLAAWEQAVPQKRKPKLKIEMLGANYRSPKKKTVETKPARPSNDGSRTVNRESADNANASAAANTTPPQSTAPVTNQTVPQPSQLSETFQVVQQGLYAMQALQQQTAMAHQRFLEGQEAAHRTFQMVMQQHQRLMEQTMGVPVTTPAPAPIAMPMPVPAAPAQPVAMPAPVMQPMAPAVAPTVAPTMPPAMPPAPAPMPQPAPASQPVAMSQPTASAGGNGQSQSLESVLVQTVSETTGYPAESIHMDMSLEDDLGIDQVKRVDLFSLLQSRMPSIHTPKGESAIRIRTLREVAEYAVSGPAPEPQVPEPTASEKAAAGAAELEQTLMEVVSELTGYPVEMLDPDMDMEADLGIDSIKRVEILAAVQTRVPGLDTGDSAYTGTLRTLRQIIDYMGGSAGKEEESVPFVEAEQATASSQPAPTETESETKLNRQVLTFVELGDARDEGIVIAPNHEIWVVDDGSGLAEEIVNRLQSCKCKARVVADDCLDEENTTVCGGLIHLGSPIAPDGTSWDDEAEQRLKNAFALTKALGPSLRNAASKGGALFATVARMDGAFGFAGGDYDPTEGAWAGLTKTVAHEWPDVYCRALDVSRSWDDAEAVAEAIVRELGSDGPIEVGLDGQCRRGVKLTTEKAVRDTLALSEGDVVLVTGGARGVTAECALALANVAKVTLVLLGRSPGPRPEPQWLAGIEGEAEIKRALLERGFAGRSKPTPAELQAAFRDHRSNREIAGNLERLQKTGAKVLYRSVDIRDSAAVSAIIDSIGETEGPVRGIIHGAGVIEDRRIDDKTSEQFDAVVDTKVAGLRTVLGAVEPGQLKCLVLFSSVTGRLGREGQVDYAMANEVLNKVAHRMVASNPSCRVASMNWGPWDGGMVTPSLSREFARLGVELIPLKAGAQCMVDEMCQPSNDAVEVIIGGTLPEPPAPKRPEKPKQDEPAVVFQRDIDPDSHPFLRSHMIGGRCVLPVAVMVEWLGCGALESDPGMLLHGINELRVLKGVVLGDSPRTIRVVCAPAVEIDGGVEANVELRSVAADGSEALHARAKAVLVENMPTAPKFTIPEGVQNGPYTRGIDGAYREILFHGKHFHAFNKIHGCSKLGMTAQTKPAPAPDQWMADPVRSKWLGDPLVVDAGLQMGILWSFEQLNSVSLPTFTGSYKQYVESFPAEGVEAVLVVADTSGRKLTADVTFVDADGTVVARLEGQEWTVDASLKAAFGRGEPISGSRP